MELIKITEKEGLKLVSARELYEFLGVSERFKKWFNKRVSKYEFIENEDFTGVKVFTVVNNGAKQEIQDYAITLDMAKELSMVQNSEKGKQARKYFIECEKVARNIIKPSYVIDDPIERAKVWIEEQEEKLILAQILAEYEPKITYLDEILNSKDSITVTQIAADYGISAIKLNKILSEEEVQYKVNGQWILKGKYKLQGYTSSNTFLDGTGNSRINTMWTQKGRLFIHNLLENKGIRAVMDY